MSSFALPNLKEPLVYSSCDVVQNMLIACGGCNSTGKAQNTTQALNLIEKREFISLPNMPRNKVGAGAVVVGDKLVTVGGIYDKQSPLDKVDIFDVEAQCWTEGPSLYQAAQNVSVIVRDNSVMCLGGLGSGMTTLSSFQSLDIRQPEWLQMPKMTQRHFGAGVFLHNDCLYVFGGRRERLCCNECECFDFAAGKWRCLPSIPEEYKTMFNGTAKLNQTVYVIAGLNEDPRKGFSNLVFSFDLDTETWTKMPSLNNSRGDFGVLAADENVLVAGGLGQIPHIGTSVETLKTDSNKWDMLEAASLPALHGSSSRCLSGRSMYLLSGMAPGGPSGAVTEVQL